MNSQENFIMELQALLKKHNWSMAIPDKNAVDHLLIGKEEALVKIVAKIDQPYDIMAPPKDQ